MPDARATLSALVQSWTSAGRSQAQFARDVLGRDAQLLADWLGGKPMPAALDDWVGRVVSITAADTAVVTVRAKAQGKPGRKPKK